MHNDISRANDALYAISPDLPRAEWVKVGMAFKAAGGELETLDKWSSQAANYNAAHCRSMWKSVKKDGGIGAGTLFQMARQHGWSDGKGSQAPISPIERPRKPAQGMAATDIWSRCEPATNEHGYIVAKRAAGVPLDALRVVPANDSLRIAGQSLVGFLMIPAYAANGEMRSAQFIPPNGAGKKLNLPGASMAGTTFTVGPTDGPAHLCEGIGAAWAVWQATGQRAIVCFGWGNVRRVAEAMRKRDPAAKLILWPDSGKESEAEKIAADVRASIAFMPPGEVDNFDANDLAQRDGHDVVAAIWDDAKESPIAYPLSVVFADELPNTYEPPDELLQGVLTAGDSSMVYGDSNSGKTFLAVDIACAVASGNGWMGRKTEQGLVVYLAAESPASVRVRLQAFQTHHGVRVPNFAVVQSPIDLFDSEADTDKIIELVRMLEVKRGQTVRLIIGDTLARLSAGANENAGQDMGLVVRRIDRIRTECKAHFLLIHHSGKNAAAGSRGWSGIRAAVDTEIEVTDTPAGKCCEITKQRDLPTKGERIGFKLDVVMLGQTKWGEPATSCVVSPSDAPVKQTTKRMGEVEGAVLEFLAAHRVGIKKAALAKHFDGRYNRSNVYRAAKTLATAQAIHEAAGMVSIAEVAK